MAKIEPLDMDKYEIVDEPHSNQDPNGFELQEDGTVTNQVDDEISLCANGCYCMTHTVEGKCGKCGADKPVDPDTNYPTFPDSSNSLKSSNSSIDQDKSNIANIAHGDQDKELDEIIDSHELYGLITSGATEKKATAAQLDSLKSALIAWRDAHTKQANLALLERLEKQATAGVGVMGDTYIPLSAIWHEKQQLDKGE